MVKIRNIELGEFPLLLAPMEDVSDPPFRVQCKQLGADMMYTEFISTEGLIRNATKSLKKLEFFEEERPLGIQIFGADIEVMKGCVEIIEEANPNLIDINFGCPVKKVVCKDAGAGILRDIPRMIKLTSEIVKASALPVTVKTRLGWDDASKNIVEVAERLQDIGIAALTIHGRTRAQMYKGSADWTLIGEIKNNPRIQIPIFGNGDIDSPQKVVEMKNRYGVDGVMIGRAAIGYPWIFKEIKHFLATGEILEAPSIEERVDVCKAHLEKSIEWKGDVLGILEMRQHYTNYFKGIPNIKPYRLQLVTLNKKEELLQVFDEIVAMDTVVF
ncbi:MAG: tRNA dihydrouridine synthase DusB [Bacteroidetes bacterium]|nr:tRNA dihydrouridine synthase DusB [Bacteroidota bacterium]MBP7399161.1 tRNA dihydrouridine synthase DusB [Chitinophagales bacterium]MBK8486500.1 tRNA dihydrouridine synthase DusB [Bacteroidota bacterium]MBP8754318.1 tRNA dihydrouridine synthase DusB [Chitinophagales bacterium]MBP9189770.1 tRNA dihydrouridine synthase DusB [Chitinophagales bacterium]